VQRLTMLVNPNGQWVLPGSPEFLDVLGDPDPDYDAELFAVKNQGFIRFSVIGQRLIEIELHPRNVALPALLAVQHQLQSSEIKLFLIKYLTTEWRSEITSSSEQAIRRLSQLCAPEFVEASRDRFIVEPLDYSALLADDTNSLRLMAQKWRISFGQFDTGLLSFAAEHNILPRMVIIGIRPKAAEPVFRFIGDAHGSWLDEKDRFRAIGEKMENLPDKEYTLWAAEFYKDVARTGQPRYDRVSAVIRRRSKPYQTQYERLVLPWTTSSDEVLVTVCNRRLPATNDQLPS
jgi:hypothetical protein